MAYRDCPHTPGVICDQQVRCSVCGWNPQVAEFRQSKLMQPKQDKKKAAPEMAAPKAAGKNNLHQI